MSVEVGQLPRLTVAPRNGESRDWRVADEERTLAVAPTKAEAERLARERLAELGGGDLVIHLRYGRTRLFRRVGTRPSRAAQSGAGVPR